MASKKNGLANIIVAGESYGQGSSREHAAICPMYLGVKMVIAKSFERIHTANLFNFGIVPAVFRDPVDYDKIKQGDELALQDIFDGIESGMLVVHDLTQKISIRALVQASQRQKAILVAGGLINATRRKAGD
jgi:aconitate hydratase